MDVENSLWQVRDIFYTQRGKAVEAILTLPLNKTTEVPDKFKNEKHSEKI